MLGAHEVRSSLLEERVVVTDRQARCVVGTEPLTSTTRGPNARGRLAALTLAVALAAPAIPALAQQLPMLATVAQAAPADAKTALNAAVAQFKAGRLRSMRVLIDTFDLIEQALGAPIHLPKIA